MESLNCNGRKRVLKQIDLDRLLFEDNFKNGSLIF